MLHNLLTSIELHTDNAQMHIAIVGRSLFNGMLIKIYAPLVYITVEGAHVIQYIQSDCEVRQEHTKKAKTAAVTGQPL
jgi:hypothetical protein